MSSLSNFSLFFSFLVRDVVLFNYFSFLFNLFSCFSSSSYFSFFFVLLGCNFFVILVQM